jgi:hypothetical protein
MVAVHGVKSAEIVQMQKHSGSSQWAARIVMEGVGAVVALVVALKPAVRDGTVGFQISICRGLAAVMCHLVAVVLGAALAKNARGGINMRNVGHQSKTDDVVLLDLELVRIRGVVPVEHQRGLRMLRRPIMTGREYRDGKDRRKLREKLKCRLEYCYCISGVVVFCLLHECSR